MNKIIAILVLLCPFVHASMDMERFPSEIPSKELIFRLAPPNGFEALKVTFQLSGKVDNEITLIEIDTGLAIHKIDSSQLNIDFSPNLNEIRFYTVGMKESYRSIYFNIFYGVPKKTECGKGKYEFLQDMVKVTIFSTDRPLIEQDDSFFEVCKSFTKAENKIAN
jgi:hypothetical protein